jgi:hypothetical protein
MDRESQRRFKELDLKLSKHDEHLIKHDKQLLAIRNLLHSGMQIMVNLETKVDALADSHIRLYGAVQELAEAQKQTAEAQKETQISLKRLEDAVKRFLDRGGNGRPH